MWIPFLLGRPGGEYTFEVQPQGMSIDPNPITSVQRNLGGGLLKATITSMVPSIKINSNFLSLTQRNQFASLVGVADTFLSFQTRDDWQQVAELATVVDSTHVFLQPNSALRLSKALVQQSFPSIISGFLVYQAGAGTGAWGSGAWGAFPWGVGQAFDPGTVTYNDLTYTLTFTNPLPSLTAAVYITYTYKGWLVDMQKLQTKYQGGWLDRATYDFQLMGA